MYLLFWIVTIVCALWSVLAIVIGLAMAKVASQKPPTPFDDFAHTEALREEWERKA